MTHIKIERVIIVRRIVAENIRFFFRAKIPFATSRSDSVPNMREDFIPHTYADLRELARIDW